MISIKNGKIPSSEKKPEEVYVMNKMLIWRSLSKRTVLSIFFNESSWKSLHLS